MKASDIQKLRDLSIEGVARHLGMTVARHKALCPFHNDSHPSLSFHVGRNTFKCFVCDAHGGVIDLAMQVLGKDFRETCRWLAEDHRVIVSDDRRPELVPALATASAFDATRYTKYFERPFLNAPAKAFLYTERKIDPRVVHWCRLTSWADRQGTPWLQIPYYDADGQLIGVQNRRLGKGEGPRFMFPRGSQCRIYNLPVLKRLQEGEELWITEGASDCWAMLSSGKKAIAIPSATLLNPMELEALRSQELNLHMYPDADAPGERLFCQLKRLFPQLVRHSLPEGIKDFGEFWAHNQQKTVYK